MRSQHGFDRYTTDFFTTPITDVHGTEKGVDRVETNSLVETLNR